MGKYTREEMEMRQKAKEFAEAAQEKVQDAASYIMDTVPVVRETVKNVASMKTPDLEKFLKNNAIKLYDTIKEKLTENIQQLDGVKSFIPGVKKDIDKHESILQTFSEIIDEENKNGWGKSKAIVVELKIWIVKMLLVVCRPTLKTGLIKDIIKLTGCVAGAVIGVPIYVAGDIVESEFLQEIGEGVYKATERTGELLGNITEGAIEMVYGTMTSNKQIQSSGFDKVIDSGVTYAEGITKGVTKMATNGIETVGAILDGDTNKAIKVGKEILKTVAVGALAISVADVLDGQDAFDDNNHGLIEVDNSNDHHVTGLENFDNTHHGLVGADNHYIDNPNTHHVTPYERTLADGRKIWVDGDGNTSVDTFGGWTQSNPNYKG
jgi:hypothetical protein